MVNGSATVADGSIFHMAARCRELGAGRLGGESGRALESDTTRRDQDRRKDLTVEFHWLFCGKYNVYQGEVNIYGSDRWPTIAFKPY